MSAVLLLLLAQQPSLTPTVVRPMNGSFATRPAPDAGVWTVTPPSYGQTAFGQARVAEPYTLFDSIHHYELDDEEWTTFPDGGTATHLPNETAIRLAADAGKLAAIRSHGQFRYQAGKGGRVLQTAVLDGLTDGGQVYRIGYFDDNDGLYWKYSASGLKFVVRSSTDGGINETEYSTTTPTSYNRLNGNIYEMTFQWLGVGEVMGYLNGSLAVYIRHAGTLPQVYMKTAFLPVSYEAQSGAGVAQMKVICSSVQSEGGSTPPSVPFGARRTTDLTVSASTADVPVIAMRLGGTFKNSTNRMQVWPTRAWCSTDNKRVRVDLIYNPDTLTNAAFADANVHSGVEVDTTATAYTGGIPLGSFGVAANTSQNYDVQHIFGAQRRHMEKHAYSVTGDAGMDDGLDTLVVAVTNPGAGNATVVCGLDWVEVR